MDGWMNEWMDEWMLQLSRRNGEKEYSKSRRG
jgi:hypothetical protein